MSEYVLFGDGIHDDTAAIQNMIDGSSEVVLPVPAAFYLISKPLVLHSNFKLKLPRFAEIRLADGSDCVMLSGIMKEDIADRITTRLFKYVNRYSGELPLENIEIEGGIWNFNNKGQLGNPLSTKNFGKDGWYSGLGFLFYNVRGFKMSNLTLKDPVNFAVTLDTVSYFDIENITFDFNEGNPYQSNMDGIHLCGNCNRGNISKLFGTCYDDIVALNAEEGSSGPITDVTVSGIYTENSYSAVRILASRPESAIRNIHISDIHGTFYHFCIAFMRVYDRGCSGVIENVTIDNVYASKSDRALVKFPSVFKYRQYGVIDIDSHLKIKNLRVSNLHRREFVDFEAPTVNAFSDTEIDGLILDNITAENLVGEGKMPFAKFAADVSKLETANLTCDGESVDFEKLILKSDYVNP